MIYVLTDSNGLIVNRIVLNSLEDYNPGNLSIREETSNKYDIGGTLVNDQYTPPNYPSPVQVTDKVSVTPRQARLALLQAGLLTQVENAVAQSGGETEITWEYAIEVNRDDPSISSIGQSLNLTEQQIDDLFNTARTL